jgi:glycosyltransferase involved in cell wall biosynthesis
MMTCMEMIHKEYLFKYDTYIDRYIFVSHRYHEFHGKIHDYFKTKGLVLYNFLSDIQTITPTSEKGDYWFYYGRLTEEKGIRTLVNVMKQFPDIQLKIAGTGPLSDSLKQTAGSNVEFLGFISGNTLYEKIKKSSFVIVPSEWWENNPLTVIESFACGKPVIGSSLGGIPEIIEDGKTGFVFEAFNVSSLIDTLNTALQIPADRYESMSANARDFAEKHFDASEHYNHLMNIYNKTIQEYDNF